MFNIIASASKKVMRNLGMWGRTLTVYFKLTRCMHWNGRPRQNGRFLEMRQFGY